MTLASALQQTPGFARQHRSTLALIVSGLVVVGLGGFILHDMQRAQRQSRAMYEHSVHDMDLISDLQYQTQEARRSMIYALTTPDANRQVESADASRAADAQVANSLGDRRRLDQSAVEVRSIARFERDWASYLAIRDEMIGSILEGSAKDALARDQRDGLAAFNRVRDDLRAIEQIFKEHALQQVSEMETLFGGTLIKLSVVLVVTLLLAGFAGRAVEKGKTLHIVRASEARLREVIGSINEGMFVLNASGSLILWNDAAERSTGVSRDRAINRPLFEAFPGWKRTPLAGALDRALQQPDAADLSELALHPTQRSRVFAARVYPFASGITVFFDDITERKQAEAKLEAIQQELLGVSRQAGMAEVATGVLHNVGNVLNSVNVSTTLLADRARQSRAAKVSQAAALLREHAADPAAFLANDPRGRQLPEYLSQLGDHLTKERTSTLAELESLQKNIGHIKDIVAMQQSYAKVSGVAESVEAVELVEDALRLNDGALDRHDVSVIREFAGGPTIIVEKHRVLQILVNLVQNAKYACIESGRPDKQLTVRLTAGETRVTICVVDNGVGISAENLTRIFNHGFTTRKDGHGFGLHSGALAARELGGCLSAHSDGPGQGATFTLVLPLEPARKELNGRKHF